MEGKDPKPSTSSSVGRTVAFQPRAEAEEKRLLHQQLMVMLQRDIGEINFIPFQPEPTVLTDEQNSYFRDRINLPIEKIVDFACQTVDQSNNPLWFELRRVRISSSITHGIKTRNDNFPVLINQLFKPFYGTKATRHGLETEPVGRKAFECHNKLKVMQCGVVISPTHPWLCCSPDGIVILPQPALLEIKCPLNRYGLDIVDRKNYKSHVKYLHYEDQEWRLNRAHSYFSQIQFSLFVLKLEKCFLYVYSKKDQVQVEVNIDRGFLGEFIPKLEWFYHHHYLQAVMNKYE